ncbi:hypothetical protein AAMO2058_001461400 [Amorphochlora amoebiformis]
MTMTSTDAKIEAAVKRATLEFSNSLSSLMASNRKLAQKIADLEGKVIELNGRIERDKLVRKAMRISALKRRERVREEKRRARSGSPNTSRKPKNHTSTKLTGKQEFQRVLTTPDGFKAFHKFCQSDDSAHNPLFWRKVSEFLDESVGTLEDISHLEAAELDPKLVFSTPDPALQLAKTIFFDYIVQGSPNEVGISKGLVQRITKDIHRLLRNQCKENLIDMRRDLRAAQTEIFAFMANYTFRRFQSSDVYVHYRTTHPLLEQKTDIQTSGAPGATGGLISMLTSKLQF